MKGKWESVKAGELKIGDIWTHDLKPDGKTAKSECYMRGDDDYLIVPKEIKGMVIWSIFAEVGRIVGCSKSTYCWKLVG